MRGRLTKLLHSLSTHSQDDSSDTMRSRLVTGTATEEVSPAHGMVFFVLNGPLDILGLSDDVWVIHIGGFKVSKNSLSFVNSSLGHEPAGRFGQPWNSCKEDEDEQKLKCERDAP